MRVIEQNEFEAILFDFARYDELVLKIRSLMLIKPCTETQRSEVNNYITELNCLVKKLNGD